MRLPRLIYLEAKTIEDARRIKGEWGERCAILAGGTDIIPMLKRGNVPSRCLVNLKGIPELNGISKEKTGGLRIGAMTTLRRIVDDPFIVNAYPLLAKAAGSVAFNQVRNMATLGGNICLDNKCGYFNQSQFWWKSRKDCYKRGGDTCYVVKGGKWCFALSAADTIPALIVLGADLLIASPTMERRVPIESFFTGDGRRPHEIEENEILTSISIPPPSEGWTEGFLKKSDRGAVDFSIGTFSLRLKRGDGGTVQEARIALNGVSTRPIRAIQTENCLTGKAVNDEIKTEAAELLLKEIVPLSQIGSSVFMRRRMIETMFEDLIEAAWLSL